MSLEKYGELDRDENCRFLKHLQCDYMFDLFYKRGPQRKIITMALSKDKSVHALSADLPYINPIM